MSTVANNQDRLTQAIAEYMRRVDAGEAVQRDRFLEANSDVAADLGQYLDNVALVEQMAGPTPVEELPSSTREAGYRETVSASRGGDSVPEKKADASDGQLTGTFGRYQIERTLGEGAMGTVYLARDTELDRRVALKVPKFDDDDVEMMERFYREARSAARLNHRHICPVHDIGEIDGIKYISIAYIKGHPLSAYVSPDRPQSELNIAAIVRKLALALDTAHREGVIHRDLKPANVMVDRKSEPIIMDFGLAREINRQEDNRLTKTGTIMGSPAYMSPEQVNADHAKIGPCSDIYSLGVMLYELLTGHLPFDGSAVAIIGQILMAEPEKPSTFRADLDPRLEAICAKMMAKEIDERYSSMKDVADALTSFLKNPGQPGGKRSVGKLESFAPVELKRVTGRSKTLRHTQQASGERELSDSAERLTVLDRFKNLSGRTKAIAGGLAGLVLLAGITIIIKIGDQTIEVASEAPNSKIGIRGDTVTVTPGDGKTVSLVPARKGSTNPEEPDVTAKPTNQVTVETVGTAGPTSLVNSAGIPLSARGQPGLVKKLTAHNSVVVCVTFSPDGKLVASASPHEHAVPLFDVSTGQKVGLLEIAGDESTASRVTFAPDGKTLAVGYTNGNIRLWDLATSNVLREFIGHEAKIYALEFTADGHRLVSAGRQTTVRVWDVATGRQITLFDKHPHKNQNYRPIQSAVFVADGTQVISTAPFGVGALRWEAETGTILQDFNDSSPGNVYLASDGSAVFMKLTGPDKHVRLTSAADGKIIARLQGHTEAVTGFEYLPDGKHVVTGSRDGTLRLWNIESEREVHRFTTDTHTTNVLDVSPDGRYVVSAGGAIPTPGSGGKELTKSGDFSLYLWQLPELTVATEQDTSAQDQPTVPDSPKPTAGRSDKTLDLKVVMYKDSKPRSFPTFGHLKIGLAILSNPEKNPPGRETFRMTMELGGERQEFTDPGKARSALLAKLKELDGAGKPYTINGKPAESPEGSGGRKTRRRGRGSGGGGGGFGGGTRRKK